MPLYRPLETRCVVRARLSALIVVFAVVAKASWLLPAVAALEVVAEPEVEWAL